MVREDGRGAFLGHGFRSSPHSAGALARFLGMPVTVLELCDPELYHLDMALAVLGDAVFVADGALTRDSRARLEAACGAENVAPVSDDEARAWMLHEILRCRPTTATAILLSQTLPDARPVLDGLALPTLLAFGRDETLVPIAAGEWLRDHVPGAELALFERSGHCPMLEEPERFNALVAEFAARL